MTDTENKTTFKRGKNPNSLKNLVPAQPGNHLSPGRPAKEDCLLSCIKAALLAVGANGLTNEQNIGNVLVEKAAGGDIKAIDLMLSYLHSKPSQGIDLKANMDVRFNIGTGYDDKPNG